LFSTLFSLSRANAKHSEVTVPSLDDWEKEWAKNPQRNAQLKLLPLDFLLLDFLLASSALVVKLRMT
jgi:hypothetical protein